MFAGMPQSFRQSFIAEQQKKLNILPGDILEPKVDVSGQNVVGVKNTP